ncbi:hypothetical protein [Streptomyces sp. NBC_01190]|uniref:hypothetical protein n=1 Tax=Streptomyces sp. NBC_01190 TaxID=2903767 RepID=UPI0038691985|nr:hypothetical protein OG519_24580 [Streptomyces sp. NBC_01190]
MRFLTNDGRFGLLVAPVVTSGESRFQLVVGGRLIGGADPSFAYGAFEEMGNLPRFSDKRLSLLSEDPDTVLAALLSEEELHDPATLSLSESLDHWLIQGYCYEGSVAMLARPYEDGSLAGPALISVIGCVEYASIVEMARCYWAQSDERFRSALWRVKIGSGDGEDRA